MTENDWLNCAHPLPMLEFLLDQASDRKLRLFACACCRSPSVSRLLRYEGSKDLITADERWCDGEVPWEDVVRIAGLVPRGSATGHPMNPVRLSPTSQAERAVLALGIEDAWDAAAAVVRQGGNLLGSTPCDLLREMFGPFPFYDMSITSAALAWEDGIIPRMAQGIYSEGSFDRLPILADALEEVGCDNEDLLTHCRGDGQHTRGCWVVDVILGKV